MAKMRNKPQQTGSPAGGELDGAQVIAALICVFADEVEREAVVHQLQGLGEEAVLLTGRRSRSGELDGTSQHDIEPKSHRIVIL